MGEGQIESSLTALFQKLGEMDTKQESNHNALNSKLDFIQNSLVSANHTISLHSNELKKCDFDRRRKNLIIFGISEDHKDLENVILPMFRTNLQISDFSLAELDFCRRLGEQPNTQRPRPIILGLTTQRRKFQILKSSKSLKGSRIFIKEDISQETREAERNLMGERNKLRAEGKYAVIRMGKLITYDKTIHDQNISEDVRNKNKRALSESPGLASNNPKKINQNSSMETSDLFNSTLIDSEIVAPQSFAPRQENTSNLPLAQPLEKNG